MPTFITTLAPIDSLSGSIGKRKTNPSKMAFISNLRKAGASATRGGAPFMYLSLRRNDRSTPVTENERAWQEKFGQIASATEARLKDPMKIAQDQAAFKEQTKYKTMHQFVFNLVRDEMEA